MCSNPGLQCLVRGTLVQASLTSTYMVTRPRPGGEPYGKCSFKTQVGPAWSHNNCCRQMPSWPQDVTACLRPPSKLHGPKLMRRLIFCDYPQVLGGNQLAPPVPGVWQWCSHSGATHRESRRERERWEGGYGWGGDQVPWLAGSRRRRKAGERPGSQPHTSNRWASSVSASCLSFCSPHSGSASDCHCVVPLNIIWPF